MKIRRASLVVALAVAMVVGGTLPASARANPTASCVGVAVSALASAGELSVAEFKGLADALGARNFGEFVSAGAQQHLGSVEACIPAAP